MAQALDNEIQKYLPLLGTAEKKSLLGVIKSFLSLKNEKNGSFDVKQYNNELEEAEAEYENGNFITHEEMINQIKQW
jgi:predicted transcriptional regulator